MDHPDPLPAAPRGHLIGLIGRDIGGSFSPQLHEAEAAAQGLHLQYRLIDARPGGFATADLPRLLEAMSWLGFAGSNITHPFKEAIVPHLAAVADEARDIGAVNTIVPMPGGGWQGHNTDWLGFGQSLHRFLPGAEVARVALIGAGGAGCAVAYAMLRHGTGELLIVDRDPAKAAQLADKLGRLFGSQQVRAADINLASVKDVDGIINATPIGMTGQSGVPFDPGLLDPRQWVADIIYVPLQTELLRRAREQGCRTMGGGGMVVYQAAQAFRLFTGVAPDAERMLAHFQRERETLTRSET